MSVNYSKTMWKESLREVDTKLLLVALILLCVGVPMQLLGFVTPGWYYLKYPAILNHRDITVILHDGLWYNIKCTDGECITISKTDRQVPKEAASYWLKFQVEATIAVAFGVASLAAAVFHRMSTKSIRKKLWVRAATSATGLVSGVLALLASGKICDDIVHLHNERIYGFSPFRTPYSAVVFGLGGIVVAIASILMFVVCVRHSINIQQPDDSVCDNVGVTNEMYSAHNADVIRSTSGQLAQQQSIITSGNLSGKSNAGITSNLHTSQYTSQSRDDYHGHAGMVSAMVVPPQQRVVYAPVQCVTKGQQSYPRQQQYYAEYYHQYPSATYSVPWAHNRQSKKYLECLGAL